VVPAAAAPGKAELLDELLEPQPLSTKPKHAIGPSAISAFNLNAIATRFLNYVSNPERQRHSPRLRVHAIATRYFR
jgi:hypothetical protein